MGEKEIKNIMEEQRGIPFEFIKENCKTIGNLRKLNQEFLKNRLITQVNNFSENKKLF